MTLAALPFLGRPLCYRGWDLRSKIYLRSNSNPSETSKNSNMAAILLAGASGERQCVENKRRAEERGRGAGRRSQICESGTELWQVYAQVQSAGERGFGRHHGRLSRWPAHHRCAQDSTSRHLPPPDIRCQCHLGGPGKGISHF